MSLQLVHIYSPVSRLNQAHLNFFIEELVSCSLDCLVQVASAHKIAHHYTEGQAIGTQSGCGLTVIGAIFELLPCFALLSALQLGGGIHRQLFIHFKFLNLNYISFPGKLRAYNIKRKQIKAGFKAARLSEALNESKTLIY